MRTRDGNGAGPSRIYGTRLTPVPYRDEVGARKIGEAVGPVYNRLPIHHCYLHQLCSLQRILTRIICISNELIRYKQENKEMNWIYQWYSTRYYF